MEVYHEGWFEAAKQKRVHEGNWRRPLENSGTVKAYEKKFHCRIPIQLNSYSGTSSSFIGTFPVVVNVDSEFQELKWFGNSAERLLKKGD